MVDGPSLSPTHRNRTPRTSSPAHDMQVVDVDTSEMDVTAAPANAGAAPRIPVHPPPDPPPTIATPQQQVFLAAPKPLRDASTTSFATAKSYTHSSTSNNALALGKDRSFGADDVSVDVAHHDAPPHYMALPSYDSPGHASPVSSGGAVKDGPRSPLNAGNGRAVGGPATPVATDRSQAKGVNKRESLYSSYATMSDYSPEDADEECGGLSPRYGEDRTGRGRVGVAALHVPAFLLSTGALTCIGVHGGWRGDDYDAGLLAAFTVGVASVVASAGAIAWVLLWGAPGTAGDDGGGAGWGTISTTRGKQLVQNQRLLYSILPREICMRVHRGDRCIQKHASLTFAFADLVAFTKMASGLSPTQLVRSLDTIFRLFDELAILHGVTKVKTIGDCYMAVTGLHDPGPAGADHIKAMVDWCLAVRERSHDLSDATTQEIHTRYGVATGPAVSGVLGSIRPVHDFWGDTVNMASRMEANSRKNRINCTATVMRHLEDAHGMAFDEIPDVFVKGKGRMSTYLVRTDSPFDLESTTAVFSGAGALDAWSPRTQQRQQQQLAILGDLEAMQSGDSLLASLKDVIEGVTRLCGYAKLEESMQQVVALVKTFARCDRATLFMVDLENEELWSYAGTSTDSTIRIPLTTGIAGWVYAQGRSVVIPDVYDDSRFNQNVDSQTGYKTTSMMCCPVKDGRGGLLAVVQAINKLGEGAFSGYDEAVLNLLCGQVGVHLLYGQMGEKMRASATRAKLFRKVIRELGVCDNLTDVFVNTAMRGKQLAHCRKCTLYVVGTGAGPKAVSPAARPLDAADADRDAYVESIASASTGRTPLPHALYTIKGEPACPYHAPHASVAAAVFRSGQVKHVRGDTTALDPSGEHDRDARCANMLCVPVFLTAAGGETEDGGGREVVGVIEFQDRLATARSLAAGFSEEDQVSAAAYADVVSQALRHIDMARRMRQRGAAAALVLALRELMGTAAAHDEVAAMIARECPGIFACTKARLLPHTPAAPLGGLTGGVAAQRRQSGGAVEEVPIFRTPSGCPPDTYPTFSDAVDRTANVDDCYGESLMAAAVVRGEEVCGVLQLLNKTRADAFDDADEAVARDIVQHIAACWPAAVGRP